MGCGDGLKGCVERTDLRLCVSRVYVRGDMNINRIWGVSDEELVVRH